MLRRNVWKIVFIYLSEIKQNVFILVAHIFEHSFGEVNLEKT